MGTIKSLVKKRKQKKEDVEDELWKK
jgi:hypothetical protein